MSGSFHGQQAMNNQYPNGTHNAHVNSLKPKQPLRATASTGNLLAFQQRQPPPGPNPITHMKSYPGPQGQQNVYNGNGFANGNVQQPYPPQKSKSHGSHESKSKKTKKNKGKHRDRHRQKPDDAPPPPPSQPPPPINNMNGPTRSLPINANNNQQRFPASSQALPLGGPQSMNRGQSYGQRQQQGQRQQPTSQSLPPNYRMNNGVQNAAMHNPRQAQAGFAAMATGSFHGNGSFHGPQNGSFHGQQAMNNMGMGNSMGNMANSMPANNGIMKPPPQFAQQFGPTGMYAQQQYYGAYPVWNPQQQQVHPEQPKGGGDSIAAPPPPSGGDSKKKKKKRKKKKKPRDPNETPQQREERRRLRKWRREHETPQQRKERHKREREERKANGDRRGRSKKRDKHDKDGRSASKKRGKSKTHKSHKKSDESPPPPPPSSGGPPGPPLPQHSKQDSFTDSSGSSDSDSDDHKDNNAAHFHNHSFHERARAIRRRPVSGVPMSVQQKLQQKKNKKGKKGGTVEAASSHLLLIHSKQNAKTSKTVQFLKGCLRKEVLFKGMDEKMISEIVEVMYRVDCPIGQCVIKQGEYGDAYFVIESGAFDILHQDLQGAQPKRVGEMLPGKAFGEGSLLYSIPRAATLRATQHSVVWALDATKFMEIRQKISQKENEKGNKVIKFLKKVVLFKNFHLQDLKAISAAVKEKKYAKDTRIVVQGDEADAFYLIKTGAAIAVISSNGNEKTVKKYTDGDYFGERGMFCNEKRAASIIATSTTRCYVIKAKDFRKLLQDPLSEEFEEQIKKYDEMAFDIGIKRPFQNLIECNLEQFEVLGILGVGSFGRVSLVKDPSSGVTYSLKKVRKNKVIETGQQEHVRNERAVLASLSSDFCCRLFGTYQDTLNIYFCMEPVLGGELFTVLRWNRRFSEKTARFYCACVVLAFEHLHSKNIIYRDLKPENLLIHSNGYCKLVDFGFAKKRNNSCTLCGTPEYLAPEVIQNNPQGFATDWWALGIFTYEMVVGHAPFQDDPNVKMYEKILTREPEFPEEPELSERLTYLIKGLLEKNSYQRLGASQTGTQDILKHPWFTGLDWEGMRRQEVEAPYVPDINGAEDLSHYDAYPDENIDEELDPDPSVYEWCEDF